MVSKEIQQVYGVLEEELRIIRITLTLDHQLRRCDPESMDLLNRAAGKVFFYLVFIMSRDLMMSTSRLLDKDTMFGKNNCTFSLLIKRMPEAGDIPLATRSDRRLRLIKRRCEPLIALRHQRLAHNDLGTKIQDLFDRETSLRGPTRDQVEKAIRSMRKLLGAVEKHYGLGSPFRADYSGLLSRFGNLVDLGGQDFIQLARCLKEGEVPSDMDNLF
jgi:AbiU2